MGDEEQQRLVNETTPEGKQGARRTLFTFILFSLCFSLNLGTVTASIPLASSKGSGFGKTLGSASLGTLYFMYTLAAMFLSVPLLSVMGTKTALVSGMALYAVYVGSYLVGRETHDATRWVIVMFGASIGGLAAGIVWPAQQGYFARCSAKHTECMTEGQQLSRDEKAEAKKKSTSLMSGVFASIYLGIEVILKVLSSLIQVWVCGSDWSGDFLTGSCEDDTRQKNSIRTVFGLYIGLSMLSSVLMLITPMPVAEDLQAAAASSGPPPRWQDKAAAAFQLIGRNPKILLMSGVNMAFGATAAFLNSYVTGTVIPDGLGDGKVGYFVSIIPLVASLESMPFGKLQECLGTKVPLLIFGMLCFGGFAGTFAIASDPVGDLGKWAVLPAMFCIFGTGRAVWEGPNKAVTADFFQGDDAQPAGANIVMQNGLTSALAYYAYAFFGMSTGLKSWICVGCAAWGIIGYLTAHMMYTAEQRRKTEQGLFSDAEEVDAIKGSPQVVKQAS
eukprot:TRINITY_DN2855_c0_g1_i1.p1 TRINITY_DN2855_c0_g1~~TRINITY_DN2855_c0_g1_i1.p1  ORF type:complete len:502 (+),score=143.52 TRINITY_DN2855_c0_g1_i1:59-1564(+)